MKKGPPATQPAAQGGDDRSLLRLIPWGHHAMLLARVKDLTDRVWYMQQTLQHGWSRNVLGMMIGSDAHQRRGQVVNNFDLQLPAPQSDLVQQTLKDPYIFDFLTLAVPFHERELETSLLQHLERFQIELKRGAFAAHFRLCINSHCCALPKVYAIVCSQRAGPGTGHSCP